MSLINESHIDVVIDEVRKGEFVKNIEIISLEKAKKSKSEIPVFLCARPQNIDYIKDKLEAKGFSVVVLTK